MPIGHKEHKILQDRLEHETEMRKSQQKSVRRALKLALRELKRRLSVLNGERARQDEDRLLMASNTRVDGLINQAETKYEALSARLRVLEDLRRIQEGSIAEGRAAIDKRATDMARMQWKVSLVMTGIFLLISILVNAVFHVVVPK
jgi:hypothetical protein